jgi:hypothetical protein
VLPGLDVAAVRHFCEQRVPPHALHQVRIEADITDRTVTVMECRAPWREDYGPEWTRRGIARFRFTAKDTHWMLYWSDRNQRWHKYDLVAPSTDVLALLDEVDRDPTCIFWG